ncbi:hypothetical protein M569_11282, partial [Genlisea aurea]
LVKGLSQFNNLKAGKVVHAHLLVIDNPYRDRVIERNSLINLYVKCGDIRSARLVFDQMPKKNIVSWGIIMAGYLRYGFPLEVIEKFRDMIRLVKLRPNKYILATLLSSCSNMGLLEQGMQCHGYALKSGLIFHLYVKNALVHMYSSCSLVKLAVQVLNSTPRSDICTFNSLLNGLLDQGEFTEALFILKRIAAECKYENWDGITCVNVLGVCGLLEDVILGKQVHCRILKSGKRSDIFVGSAAVDMYGKCGEISSARKIFDELDGKTEVTWTAFLNALFHNDCPEEALQSFLEMKELEHVSPNEYTIAVMLNSCAAIPANGYGCSLHALAVKMGMQGHTIVCNALIYMDSRCGLIEDAIGVFNSMLQRDVISWNLVISGYAFHGLGKEALHVFRQMLAENVRPNYVTLLAVLSSCSVLGLVDDGFDYLNSMRENFGIEPGLEHYTCIVGLLCRAGRLVEAEVFMKSSPVKWDVVSWRTLLSACHVHRNYALGEKVADIVMQMNPDDAGTWILISNMHAKAKRWDKVVAVRSLMRGRRRKKEPGISWIEIGNDTHVFVSDDDKHIDSVQIREKIKSLIAEIKPLGYNPDCSCELHDVEEEQKEDQLNYHSEKLAIAFALMKTPPGAPIRVMKNLRMCDDCHSAAKFISSFTKRRIIVRDVNRFHSFSNGCCSCADYW